MTAKWAQGVENETRGAWERMRIASTILLQPNLKKGARLTPQKLLPLPWDGGAKGRRTDERPKLKQTEERERMRRIREKFGDTI